MITFDHIAITAPSLEEGVSYLHNLTGLTIPKGGEHPDMGTYNHLTALGPDTFAEVIAINPDAPKPDHPRWFNLDHVTEPKISWLLRTDDIEGCIAKAATFGIDLGRAMPLQRGDLRWRFTVRDDGTIPIEGAAPLILQWDTDGSHPASQMTDQGLRMNTLTIETPYANELAKLLEVIGLKDLPEIKQAQVTKVSANFLTVTKSIAV
jgi:hypothetical protein